MSLIAKHTVKHDGMTFTPGQHVDATGADEERLIALGAVDPKAKDAAAEKATEARRTAFKGDTAAKDKKASTAKAAHAKESAQKAADAADAAEHDRRSKLTQTERAAEDAANAAK